MNRVSENLTLGEIQKNCDKTLGSVCNKDKINCPYQIKAEGGYECYFTHYWPCEWGLRCLNDNPELGGDGQ